MWPTSHATARCAQTGIAPRQTSAGLPPTPPFFGSHALPRARRFVRLVPTAAALPHLLPIFLPNKNQPQREVARREPTHPANPAAKFSSRIPPPRTVPSTRYASTASSDQSSCFRRGSFSGECFGDVGDGESSPSPGASPLPAAVTVRSGFGLPRRRMLCWDRHREVGAVGGLVFLGGGFKFPFVSEKNGRVCE